MAKSISRSIYFNQCDPAGILFFAEIFTICHNAYEDLISDEDGLKIFNHPSLVFPIVNTEANYQFPILMGDVELKIFCKEIGTSSYTFSFEVYQNQKLCTVVDTKHVTIDIKTKQPTTVPEELRRWLESNLRK